MTKRILCCLVLASCVVACTTQKPQPDPPVWSSSYNVPYTEMANCLAAKPIGGFTGVPRIQPESGMATVTLSLIDGTPMAINFVVRRTGSGTSQVEWKRFLTVGGWEPIDTEARARADACGGV